MSAFVLLCAAHLDTYISLFAHLGLKNLLLALLSLVMRQGLERLKKFAADCSMQPIKAP